MAPNLGFAALVALRGVEAGSDLVWLNVVFRLLAHRYGIRGSEAALG